jgi:leader peptidase (prepilin peptidase)/N-methyltransferase
MPARLGPSSWIWPIVVAPFIGSFLGVVITRAKAPRTILWTRSICDACGHTLGPADLVPLASWAASGGHCRYCATRIGLFYPAVELAALGVAVSAAWAASLAGGWLLWVSCALGWTLLVLAAIDWREYRLPDLVTLPLIPAGLAVHYALAPEAAFSFQLDSLLTAVIGAVTGYALLLLVRWAYAAVRHREGLGLGDAKLFAAAGAWVGWPGLPSVLLVAALAALASVLLRYSGKATLRSDDRVPFGTFLCLGMWVVWLYGPLA